MSKRALERYAAKRTFTRTPEPPRRGARPPRTVAVRRAETCGAAPALRLSSRARRRAQDPGRCPRVPRSIRTTSAWRCEVEDHPFDYASFEGVIPAKQYGAGKVIVWDCGVYSPDEGAAVYASCDRDAAQKRVRAELAAGKLSFFLCGEKLKGSYTLVRTRTTNQWLLIKHRDRFAQPERCAGAQRSVLSGLEPR